MSMKSIPLSIGGILLSLDGFLNFIYWQRQEQEHKILFQIGRLIRGTAGVLFTLSLWI